MYVTYRYYKMNAKEILINSIYFSLFGAVISFLFYDSVIAFFVIMLALPVFLKKKSNEIKSDKRNELKSEFCEMIGSISTSISAGMSVENAFKESKIDMEKMYGQNAPIVMELIEIERKLKLNVPMTECLKGFSENVQIEDINDFVTVFTEAEKSGGNLKEIIKNTVSIIQEKKRTEDEIESMLKGKMLEQKVISIIPFLIFIYLRLSSAEFISVLYHNPTGIAVMTVCLIVYVLSIGLSQRIIDIRV